MKRIVSLLLCALACHCQASLKFGSTRLEFNAEPNTDVVHGAYEFTNNGDHEVKILSLKPSCGCTTAKLDKETYAPGESGTIQVTMELPEEGGIRQKLIYVTTNDPDAREITLEIVADVKPILSIVPRLLVWRNGEDAIPKQAFIQIVIDNPVHIPSVVAEPEGFTTRLDTTQDGKRYVLWLTPKATDKPMTVMVTLTTDYPTAKPAVYHVYGRVIPPPTLPTAGLIPLPPAPAPAPAQPTPEPAAAPAQPAPAPAPGPAPAAE